MFSLVQFNLLTLLPTKKVQSSTWCFFNCHQNSYRVKMIEALIKIAQFKGKLMAYQPDRPTCSAIWRSSCHWSKVQNVQWGHNRCGDCTRSSIIHSSMHQPTTNQTSTWVDLVHTHGTVTQSINHGYRRKGRISPRIPYKIDICFNCDTVSHNNIEFYCEFSVYFGYTWRFKFEVFMCWRGKVTVIRTTSWRIYRWWWWPVSSEDYTERRGCAT